jgi:chemotaxis protein CheX
MDVSYINPFLVAIRNVFDKMVHVPVALGKPYLKDRSGPQFAVSASIDLAGAMVGRIAISFSQSAALALASGMAGKPLTGLDADCLDALGEIASMVTGDAKKDLPGDGLTTISVPSIVLGSHKVVYPQNSPILVVPCETPKGRFVVEVSIRRQVVAKAA